MYFHIDEAGNTGNNIFDQHQPRLSYGVLSCTKNVDVLAQTTHKKILQIVGKDQLHANELGIAGITRIALLLMQLHRRIKFDFDYYFIEKRDYALVLFFDTVFDAGLNEAVPWHAYWTPLRYVLLLKLGTLFDLELLKKAWELCIAKKVHGGEDDIRDLLAEVRNRAVASSLDGRTKEIILDALDFGLREPLALDFGAFDPKLTVPNSVAFQFVVSCIARRTRKKRRVRPRSIIVDRQTEFNSSQAKTHQHRRLITEGLKRVPTKERESYTKHPLFATFDEEDVLTDGLADTELTFSNSRDSIGLQLVDVYLWIANRVLSKKSISEEVMMLWTQVARRSTVDGISMDGMAERFARFEAILPGEQDLGEAEHEYFRKIVEEHRAKVRTMKNL